MRNINLKWEVGVSDAKNTPPEVFFPAEVPGAVQLDYMRANGDPDLFCDQNVTAYKALEDKFWHYRTRFEKPALREDETLLFSSKGIDYAFDILLNGNHLLYQEGMFTPVEIPLSEGILHNTNFLEVIIYPIPKVEGAEEGRRQAARAVKPAVGYGWDWHPRLVPAGIWDETYLQVVPGARIAASELSSHLNADLSEARINIFFEVQGKAFSGITWEWQLYDPDDREVLHKTANLEHRTVDLKERLKAPRLWWPHDQGTPSLYTWTLKLTDAAGEVIDFEGRKTGFKKVEMVLNPGTEIEPDDWPKTARPAPFTLRINNRPVFAKGSNWVHPEIFYGTLTRERYQELLTLVKNSHMNLLRVWGGGIVNKELFYDRCDEMGIMVWQEFPLACNDYPNDPHYLEILEQEAVSIIKKVRKHPSLVIWSGGNELLNSWSGMTEQAYPLRLLNCLCYRLDPHTPFISSSPLNGVGHGHYIFYDPASGEDVFQLMRRSEHTAYTEFGMPSLTFVSALKRIIPEAELFPAEPTEAWKIHHAFGAWQENSWLEKPTLEKYFGVAGSLEELVEQSQTLQSIGYKAIFEEARRQKPHCSMALNWCFNEPWPTAANNSLVAYPAQPKPAWDAVKDSLRPVMASVAFERFDYSPGAEIVMDLWLLNDAYEEVSGGEMELTVSLNGIPEKVGRWSFGKIPENTNGKGPSLRYVVPGNTGRQLMEVTASVIGNEALDAHYLLLIADRENATGPGD